MNTIRRVAAATAVLILLGTRPVCAQRVQFPTMVEQPAPVGPPATFAPAGAPAPSPWDPYAAPGANPSGYAPTTVYQPAVQAAPAYSPYAPAPYAPAPYAQAPYSPTPNALYPDGAPNLMPEGFPPPMPKLEWPRLLQELRVQDTWVVGNGHDSLEVEDLEFSGTFAFPWVADQAPFLLTSGTAIHWFGGPASHGVGSADLPPRTYDEFVDLGWNPQFSPYLGAELGVRVGLYTDFDSVSSESIRILGRGLVVLTYTPTLQFKAGIVYIDRNNIKLLPAGGFVYTPNADTRYEVVFPRPKLAQRLTTVGNTNIWGYVAGEYGGGSWTIRRDDGSSDSFDYNDIRVLLGLETMPESPSAARGHIEVGYVFDRQLEYVSLMPPKVEPNNTFLLRAGLSF